MMREQEIILKSLSNKKNPPTVQPSLDRDTQVEGEQQKQAHDNPTVTHTQ